MLSRRYHTLKNEANLNTEIGVPLTLLDLQPEHQRAVLELGMYLPGDIALLARISAAQMSASSPTSAPCTWSAPARSDASSPARRSWSKRCPPDGLAVLNGDDAACRDVPPHPRPQRALRPRRAVRRARDGRRRAAASTASRSACTCTASSVAVDCPLPGRTTSTRRSPPPPSPLNDGMSLDEIAAALHEARLDLRLTVRPGPNGSTLIDDSYNASPASMIAALDLLAETPGRRVALLGHMRELGAAERDGHERVGAYAAGALRPSARRRRRRPRARRRRERRPGANVRVAGDAGRGRRAPAHASSRRRRLPGQGLARRRARERRRSAGGADDRRPHAGRHRDRGRCRRRLPRRIDVCAGRRSARRSASGARRRTRSRPARRRWAAC